MVALMGYDVPTYPRLTHDPTERTTSLDRPLSIGRAYRLREGADVALISIAESGPHGSLLEKYGLTAGHVVDTAHAPGAGLSPSDAGWRA